MVLHAANVVAVYFDDDTIFEKAVLLVACLDHDPAIEAAHLLHLSHNKVSLHEVLPHVELVLLDFAPLDSSRQVDRSQIE